MIILSMISAIVTIVIPPNPELPHRHPSHSHNLQLSKSLIQPYGKNI